MSSTDKYYFENSLEEQMEMSVLKDKQFLYQQDDLNASNPTQIRYVLSGFRSSDKACNIAEGFLAIPLVLAVSKQALPSGTYAFGKEGNLSEITVGENNSVDFTNSTSAINTEMMVVLKNHINLIESMSVEIDGNSIIQLQPKLNLYNNFRLHQYTDYNDYINNKEFKGYAKDDNSWLLTPFNKLGKGNGIINNDYDKNTSLNHHLYSNNINIEKLYLKERNWSAFYDVNNIDPTKSYRTTTADTMINYYVAYIPLADLSDVFSKLPPTRGLNMNILLNLNTNCVVDLIYLADNAKNTCMYVGKSALIKSQIDLTTSVSATSNILAQYTAGINNSNGCTPFMITQPSSSNPTIGSLDGWALFDKTNATNPIAQRLTIGLYYSNVRPSVSDQSSIFTQSHPLKVARLYAPMVDFQAVLDNSYFEKNTNKTILYDDIIALPKFNMQNAFNEVLSPSLLNIKGLLTIPYWGQIATGKHEFENPFSSAPNTSSIFDIQDFNVLLASKNVYQEDNHYGFQEFIYELNKNFGKVEGNKGHLSYYDFNNLYHYYYVNLQRHVQENEVYGKSIAIKGLLKAKYNPAVFNSGGKDVSAPTNNVVIDLYNFVILQRKLQINCDTGKIISVI